MPTEVNGKTMICPVCNSTDVVNNGSIHTGKDKFLCNKCGHQFVASNSKSIDSDVDANSIIYKEGSEYFGISNLVV